MDVSDPDDLRTKVLSWMEETGRGYKAASREWGVPRSTIQGWARGGKAGKAHRPRARARARTRARDSEKSLVEEDEDYVSFLQRKIRELEEDRLKASEARHSQTVARLQELTGRYREKLESALQARDAAARAAGELPDPASLARQVLSLVPVLARFEPDACRRIAAELESAIGQ